MKQENKNKNFIIKSTLTHGKDLFIRCDQGDPVHLDISLQWRENKNRLLEININQL